MDRIECQGCSNLDPRTGAKCPVRLCALERKIESCAFCGEFTCDKLLNKLEFIEKALDRIETVSNKDFRLFFRPYLSRVRLMEIRKNPESGKIL
jgi:hypothetical protein